MNRVGDLRITVTVEEYQGENDRGYAQWETQAQLAVKANAHRTWRVFSEALDVLRGPCVVIGETFLE